MKHIVLCKEFNGVARGGEVDITAKDAARHVAFGRLISKRARDAMQEKRDERMKEARKADAVDADAP